jgi:hypothetical protein
MTLYRKSVYEKLSEYYQSVGRNDKAYHMKCIREHLTADIFLHCMFEVNKKLKY